jgi:hypothetical protein
MTQVPAPENMSLADVMAEIRTLAATRKHRLARHMLQRSLHPAQAHAVLKNLRKCPPVPETTSHEFPVEPPAPAETQPELPLPRTSVPPPLSAFKDIPAGYFATRSASGSEVIDYWLIQKGKGKWSDSSFARRVLGGASAGARKLRSVELTNMQQRLAMRAITEFGLEESQNLFADTLTRCLDCSIPLTDRISREARRGPDCRKKQH